MNRHDIVQVLYQNGLNQNVITHVMDELEVLQAESTQDEDQISQEIQNEYDWSSRDFTNKIELFATERFPVRWLDWPGLSDYTTRQLSKNFNEPSHVLGLRLVNSRDFLEGKLESCGIRERQKKLICDQIESWMSTHDI